MASASICEGLRIPALESNKQTLGDLLDSSAQKYPKLSCMKSGDENLSYEYVSRVTSTMAQSIYTAKAPAASGPLITVGVSIVALWHPRGIPCLLAQIAIAKSGAAWLPFDFDAPISRIAVCLADASVGMLVTSPEGKARLLAYAASPSASAHPLPANLVILTPQDLQTPPASSSSPYLSAADRGLRPHHKAYLIYTSGSTGVPKGITITHANAVHYLLAVNTIYQATSADVMLQTASVAFDLSVEEIWLLFTVGGSLYVASQEEVQDVEGLPALLRARGVTMMDTVPTLLGMISSNDGSSAGAKASFPALRTIILGGEALPRSVLADWSAPGRQIFNTYGPTETTIVATTWLCGEGEISIGKPIPNYICYVVDPDTMKLCPKGTQGELWVGGLGVAQGYYQRPELTAAKFVPNPFTTAVTNGVLYRTGDACVMGPSGDVYFHGRIDDQVKVRGFRIELGEIEAHIDTLGAGAVKRGQVAVVVSPADADVIVAFVVLEAAGAASSSSAAAAAEGGGPLPPAVRALLVAQLRELVPAYMVPEVFVSMPVLPRLASSGKIDRNALKALARTAAEDSGGSEGPGEEESASGTGGAQASWAGLQGSKEVQGALSAAACAVFKTKTVKPSADFFTELGGHSLAVSQFLSALRKAQPNTALSALSFRDIYASRNLANLAALVASRQPSSSSSSGSKGSGAGSATGGEGGDGFDSSGLPPGIARNGRYVPPPWIRRYLCGLAQAISVVFFLFLSTIKWLGLFLAGDMSIRLQCPHKVFRPARTHKMDDYADDYQTYEKCNFSTRLTIMTIIYTFLTIYIAVKILVVVLKWMVIGRTRPGVYPMWGQYYFRVWFVGKLVSCAELEAFYGSPLVCWYFRLLGANIGPDANINAFDAEIPDLVTVGANATIGNRVMFETGTVTGDLFIIGPITIGEGANIGALTVLGRECEIGAGSVVNALSCIHDGCVIPPGQEWDGSPVSFVRNLPPPPVSAHVGVSETRKTLEFFGYAVAYIFILVLSLSPVFTAFFFLSDVQDYMYNYSDDDSINESNLITPNSWSASWPVLLLLIWPTSFICMTLTLAIGPIVRRTLFPFRFGACTVSVHSWLAFRFWFMAKIVDITLESCQSFYATIWMVWWYKSMGTGVTFNSEVSTKICYFDLVNLGENSFLADDSILSEDDVSYGWLTVGHVTAGSKAFFGNDCVVPHGSELGSNVLLGVKSIMPRSKKVQSGEIHFGSPSIALPTMQKQSLGKSEAEMDSLTYSPGYLRYWLRAFFEMLVIPIPLLILIFYGYVGSDYVAQFYLDGDMGRAAMVVVGTGPVLAVSSVALMIVIKWGWMGIFRPGTHLMWSVYCVSNEAFQHVFLATAGAFCLKYFIGTPILPNLLRLFGVKIGHGCYLGTIDIPEFDCVEIGDYCVIGRDAGLQTHLFENRVLKIGPIKMGSFCHISVGSTVLYDTELKSGVHVGPMSVVMKGETVQKNSFCLGIPTRTVVVPPGTGASHHGPSHSPLHHKAVEMPPFGQTAQPSSAAKRLQPNGGGEGAVDAIPEAKL